MNPYKMISDTLDIFVRQIAKTSYLIPQNGLMTGKMGVAILLYRYGRYRNDPEVEEYADRLIELVFQKIGQINEKGFDNGVYGIVWGMNYLIKQGFLQADEDIFDEIDTVLLDKGYSASVLQAFGIEAEKGLYILGRFISDISSTGNKWCQHVENCVNQFYKILISKYTSLVLPVFPCIYLIRFFHVCQTVWECGLFRHEIGLLYEEIPEIVKVSYKEEKSISEKHILATLLDEVPIFKGCIPINDISQLATLTEVNNFYLTQLILDRKTPIPEVVNKSILSIAEDQERINGLLEQLNPYYAGLGSNVGGLAWTMMQWCMEQDN